MKLILAILVLAYAVGATRLVVQNNCGNRIEVIRTENGRDPVVHRPLNPGESYPEDFGGGRGMNFKSGWNGLTLAEFTFDTGDGNDYYDLSVIVGYDIGMRLEAPDRTLNCFERGCPDAYQYPEDNSKTHGVRTGGTFTLNFCR